MLALQTPQRKRDKRGNRRARAENKQQQVYSPGDTGDRQGFPLQKGDSRPLNARSKNQNPRLHDFETGRSQRVTLGDKGSKKARRVSQRRELAVVTLGAVASIAGLGGFLAANPPSWSTTPEAASPEVAATAEANPDGAAQGDEGTRQREADVGSNPAGVEPAPIRSQEETSEPPLEQASPAPPAPPQAPIEEAPPVWSAPSQAPAAAESRGS